MESAPTRPIARRCSSILIGILMAASVSVAYAGDSVGPVGAIEVIASAGGAPGNYDLRVTLSGSPVICNGQTWAYVDTTDANYGGIMANVLAARTVGAQIVLYWSQQSNGYCQITAVSW